MDALEAYIKRKEDWAARFVGDRIESNVNWIELNPEWEFCRQHKKCVRVVSAQENFNEPTLTCKICLKKEDSLASMVLTINDSNIYSSIEDAHKTWSHTVSILKALSRSEKVNTNDGYFDRQFQDTTIQEWYNWIRYEIAIFKLGMLISKDPTKEPDNQAKTYFKQKMLDSIARNGRNTDRAYCLEHNEMGDEWPWRTPRSRYKSCNICLNSKNSFLSQKQPHIGSVLETNR